MPESPELRIMSDFINEKSINRTYTKMFHVEKGNDAIESDKIKNFKISSKSIGKELILNFHNKETDMKFSVFMGMSGNWKFVKTEEWNNTKFTRMRLDSEDGLSLLLYGGYMGPKYKLNGFSGVKRGPDSVRDFNNFKENILNNLDKKNFDKPICETLLNQKYFNGIGAYLNAEIIGRLDINPFRHFNSLSNEELENVFNMILQCQIESYNFGGGELKDWNNPFGKSKINEWIKFYGNKDSCFRQKFGKRNIWINKKWKLSK
jgi:endonuclease VIII-like 1